METVLFWLYLAISVLLITHEMDSVRWKEWDVFGLGGDAEGFILLHIPLLALALYGLVLIHDGAAAGPIFAIILGLASAVGFGLHMYFIRAGRKEFTTPASLTILWAMLLGGLAQVGLATYILVK